MPKPWPDRDQAPWGNGDPDGEEADMKHKPPGPGEVENRAPAKAPDSDFSDR